MVVTLSIFLLSLLGLPPLVGFTAKFQIFAALWDVSQALVRQGRSRPGRHAVRSADRRRRQLGGERGLLPQGDEGHDPGGPGGGPGGTGAGAIAGAACRPSPSRSSSPCWSSFSASCGRPLDRYSHAGRRPLRQSESSPARGGGEGSGGHPPRPADHRQTRKGPGGREERKDKDRDRFAHADACCRTSSAARAAPSSVTWPRRIPWTTSTEEKALTALQRIIADGTPGGGPSGSVPRPPARAAAVFALLSRRLHHRSTFWPWTTCCRA